MKHKTDSIIQRFLLNEEERRRVVYASVGRDDEAQWAVLKAMGAQRPPFQSAKLAGIRWDPNAAHGDSQCLVVWVIGGEWEA